MQKTIVYIDGFNLYHSIEALRKPWLKWLNLSELSKTLIRHGDALECVNLFTTLSNWDAGKRSRHLNYIKAQEIYGVKVHHGKFYSIRKSCRKHQRSFPFHEEKYTDVAIAVSLLADSYANRFDRAIVVTADSDMVPVARHIRSMFPNKELTLASPPGRMQGARDLGDAVHTRVSLEEPRLNACLLPHEVRNPRGRVVARMPEIYLTPECPFYVAPMTQPVAEISN